MTALRDKAREVRTSTSYPTVHLRFDIHASSLLGEIKPPLIASRQAHPPMPSSLEAPSSNGEAPDQKRRGQRKTTQPAASNRLMGLLRRYTRVRIHPNRVLLRPAPDVVEPLLRLGETVLRDETRRYHGLRITHAAQYRIHLAVQLQGGIRGIRWQRAIVVADCSRREPVEPC